MPGHGEVDVPTITRRAVLATVAAGAVTACFRKPEPDAPAVVPIPTEPNVLQPAWLETTIGDTPVRVRAYNGQIPGPTLTFTPGEDVHVQLRNRLTRRGKHDAPVHDIDVPHDFEATNLHYHGMDIKPHLFNPLGTEDPLAKMISIAPGENFDYTFRVPADHPSGLYWYHPHQHGSTAVQAVSGMAGPLIVKGPIDEVPEIKAAREVLMAIQDIGLFKSDEPGDTRWTYNPQPRMIWQTFGGVVQEYNKEKKTFVDTVPPLNGGYTTGDYALRYLLMNGKAFFKETHNAAYPQSPVAQQLAPQTIVTMAQGEVVRFRVLNGCSDNFMPIHVQGHDMHVIALDGVNFQTPRVMSQVELAPGNRVEFLLKAKDVAGDYSIIQEPQAVQFLDSPRKVIATITVTADSKPMPLPATLPTPTRYYPLIKQSQVNRPVRTITFSTKFRGPLNPQVGMDFMINGVLYAETVAGVEVDLDAIEEWHLVLPKGESEGHPFHIHVNHFEVISVNGVPQPSGVLKDTIWIPKPTATEDSVIVLRTKFKEFTGKAVFHCHILPHEDTGMMSNITIRKKG